MTLAVRPRAAQLSSTIVADDFYSSVPRQNGIERAEGVVDRAERRRALLERWVIQQLGVPDVVACAAANLADHAADDFAIADEIVATGCKAMQCV